MNLKFKNGTVVWLKSGSPAMTINAFHLTTKKYVCLWFIDNSLKEGFFKEEALTDIDPKASVND